MELNRAKTSPALYMQIAGELLRKIEDRQYVCGDIIPGEYQLAEQYGVSRMTAKLALTQLESKGYVERKRGKGTVVIYGKISEALKEVVSFSEEMKQNGVTMKTTFCRIEAIHPDRFTASKLQVSESDVISRLVRIRSAINKPLVYTTTYLKLEGLPLDAETYHQSLYAYLKEQHQIIIAKAVDQLEAVNANKRIAESLEIEEGSAAFKRVRFGFDQYQKLVEYSISYYPGERYKYEVIL